MLATMEYIILILVLLISNILHLSTASDDIIVNTKLGKVRGTLMKTRLGRNIFAFRSLYYAEPPVGQLRFKDPVPVKNWNNVFNATVDGPACMQTGAINLSENCLTLNIYTKQINNTDKKLPVIVYIHPGRYFRGTSQSSTVGPKYLLDHDIVLVTMNYRIGSLGFLNTGDKYATGNYGLKDQVLALKFVRDHISNFGGNPNSITLTGQSAGSRSIVLHMVSPLSKGLFHRAIAMSGSSTTPLSPQKEQIDVAERQAKLLGCPTNSRGQMLSCLRERPAEQFGRRDEDFLEWNDSPTLIWYPSVEPKIPGIVPFLPDDPVKLMQRGQIVNNVPLIIGFTKDEYGFKPTLGIWEAMQGNYSYFQQLNDNWYELAPICFGYERNTSRSKFISDELKKFYFNDQPISLKNSDNLRKLFGNALVHYPVYRAANLLSQYSFAPVYLYEFTQFMRNSRDRWPDTGKATGIVSHADDLQYIFNNDRSPDYPFYNGSDPEVEWVNRMTSLWAHFATTGEPLPKGLALSNSDVWKTLDPINKMYLKLGDEMRLETDFQGEAMRLWEKLFS